MLVGYLIKADPGATMTFVAGGALKPIGGHILSHASATRMFLRKGVCIAMCGSVAVEDPRSWSHRRRADKRRHVFAPQVAPKNVSPSWLTVRTSLRARPHTSSMKAGGQTSDRTRCRQPSLQFLPGNWSGFSDTVDFFAL